jgi:hypothetical protein
MRWAALDVQAEVIILSPGSIDLPGADPLEEAVSTLSAQTGTLFMVAADPRRPTAPVSMVQM